MLTRNVIVTALAVVATKLLIVISENDNKESDCLSTACSSNSTQSANHVSDYSKESDYHSSNCSADNNPAKECEKTRLTLPDFLNGKLDSLTRREREGYLLPGVAAITPKDAFFAQNEAKAFNPLLDKQRPQKALYRLP